MALAFTPLESAVLARLYELHAGAGFPASNHLEVTSRDNTPCGRYVGLQCVSGVTMADGYYDLGGGYIEMAGIPNGMMAVAKVAQGVPVELEFAVYGGASWDGAESHWSIK